MGVLVEVADIIEFVVYCLLFPIFVLLLLVLVARLELNMPVTPPLPLMVVTEELHHSTLLHAELQAAKVVSESYLIP